MKYSLLVEVTPLSIFINNISSGQPVAETIFYKNFSSNKNIKKLLTNYENIRITRVLNSLLAGDLVCSKYYKLILYGKFSPLAIMALSTYLYKVYNDKCQPVYLDINKIRFIYRHNFNKSSVSLFFLSNLILIGYKNHTLKLVEFGDVVNFEAEIIKYDINPIVISEISLFIDKSSIFELNIDIFIKKLLMYFPFALVKNREGNIADEYLKYCLHNSI